MKNSKATTRYKTISWVEYNQEIRNRPSFVLWLDATLQWYANPIHQKGLQKTYSDVAIQNAYSHTFSTKFIIHDSDC